mmetsp:Transcript_23001/g.57592  ORF Transcript_23001/g.57592 Transcript_23001/m.57592 type:complete len:663 (+) Transcript_23001:257-2245(+)
MLDLFMIASGAKGCVIPWELPHESGLWWKDRDWASPTEHGHVEGNAPQGRVWADMTDHWMPDVPISEWALEDVEPTSTSFLSPAKLPHQGFQDTLDFSSQSGGVVTNPTTSMSVDGAGVGVELGILSNVSDGSHVSNDKGDRRDAWGPLSQQWRVESTDSGVSVYTPLQDESLVTISSLGSSEAGDGSQYFRGGSRRVSTLQETEVGAKSDRTAPKDPEPQTGTQNARRSSSAAREVPTLEFDNNPEREEPPVELIKPASRPTSGVRPSSSRPVSAKSWVVAGEEFLQEERKEGAVSAESRVSSSSRHSFKELGSPARTPRALPLRRLPSKPETQAVEEHPFEVPPEETDAAEELSGAVPARPRPLNGAKLASLPSAVVKRADSLSESMLSLDSGRAPETPGSFTGAAGERGPIDDERSGEGLSQDVARLQTLEVELDASESVVAGEKGEKTEEEKAQEEIAAAEQQRAAAEKAEEDRILAEKERVAEEDRKAKEAQKEKEAREAREAKEAARMAAKFAAEQERLEQERRNLEEARRELAERRREEERQAEEARIEEERMRGECQAAMDALKRLRSRDPADLKLQAQFASRLRVSKGAEILADLREDILHQIEVMEVRKAARVLLNQGLDPLGTISGTSGEFVEQHHGLGDESDELHFGNPR